ncbi:uncharacterized protein TRIVIDRAFT_153972, partial [Trichoderma virens Gv29-8]
ETLQKLRVWLLGTHKADERYDDSVRKRLSSTCNWILERPEFTSWRSESPSSPKMLWIHGPPGFGKTILCARVIEHIKIEQQEPVAYYFFSSDLESHKDPIVAMRSWIYHIALASDSVIDIVNKKWSHGVAASQRVIIELFREAIKLVSNYTLVVDGLDECAPGGSCLSMSEFVAEVNEAVHGTNARILVMSRHESRIHRALMEAKNAGLYQYEVRESDVRSDIEALSKHIVAKKLSDEETSIQADMAKKMSDRSKGQFLWLRLQEDSLIRGLSQVQLQNAVDETPADLSSLYARSWAKIYELPENEKTRAISLLRLAAFSLRPLTVREISEAVLARDEYEDFPVRELPDQWDTKYVKHRILDLCNSLLETRMQNAESTVGEWTIHLIHFSAKEFLLGHISYQDTVRGNIRLMLAAEHTILTKLCIRYMNHSHVWQGSTGRDEPQSLGSFTNYAMSFWYKHAVAGAAQQTKLMEIENFFNENNPSWIMWRKWFDSTHIGWKNDQSEPAIPLCYAIELGFVDLATAMIKQGKVRVNCHSSNRTALGKDLNAVTRNEQHSILLVACFEGKTDIVKLLIHRGADLTQRDSYGQTPLFAASCNGFFDIVKLLLDHGANDMVAAQDNGKMPLYAASCNGFVDIAELLLKHGADHTMTAKNGQTPLYAACGNGHIEVAKLLINSGANVLTTEEGRTPLSAACSNGHLNVARLLIDKGANIMLPDKMGSTPLYAAAFRGSFEIVEMLIEMGADVSTARLDGYTALHVASVNGYADIVELLIKKGANVMASNKDGETPLLNAAANGHLKVVSLLLDNGARLTEINQNRQTSLYVACCNGHVEVAKLLLEKGADITATEEKEQTPLFAACSNGHLELVQLLVEEGADLHALNIDGVGMAYTAACNGQLEVLQLLLSLGVDIITKSKAGWLPIHIASASGHAKIVDLLIENGADIMVGNGDGNTPLILATFKHYVEVVNVLLKHGVDVDAQDSLKQTSLFLASCGSDIEMSRLLVENCANVSIPNNKGQTPLLLASYSGNLEIIKLLLENGADMRPDEMGHTPAYAASYNGHVNALRLLIKWGADVTIQNKRGLAPIHIACRFGHIKVVKLLLKKGLDVNSADNDGISLLHSASLNGHVHTARYLVENGVSVNTTVNHATPLFSACLHGHKEVVKILLQYDADKSITDQYGITPAKAAVRNGHIEIVGLLNAHKIQGYEDRGFPAIPNAPGERLYGGRRAGIERLAPVDGRRMGMYISC